MVRSRRLASSSATGWHQHESASTCTLPAYTHHPLIAEHWAVSLFHNKHRQGNGITYASACFAALLSTLPLRSSKTIVTLRSLQQHCFFFSQAKAHRTNIHRGTEPQNEMEIAGLPLESCLSVLLFLRVPWFLAVAITGPSSQGDDHVTMEYSADTMVSWYLNAP